MPGIAWLQCPAVAGSSNSGRSAGQLVQCATPHATKLNEPGASVLPSPCMFTLCQRLSQVSLLFSCFDKLVDPALNPKTYSWGRPCGCCCGGRRTRSARTASAAGAPRGRPSTAASSSASAAPACTAASASTSRRQDIPSLCRAAAAEPSNVLVHDSGCPSSISIFQPLLNQS